MNPVTDTQALVAVQSRLAERFPEVPSEVVEAAVRVARSELTGGALVEDAALVEKAARERLLAFAPEGEKPASGPIGRQIA